MQFECSSASISNNDVKKREIVCCIFYYRLFTLVVMINFFGFILRPCSTMTAIYFHFISFIHFQHNKLRK